MEEGFMLVFPERVLEGDVPNVDFLHLYGPGSLWFLAGVFEVFGTSLLAERLVGLLQLVGIVFGVFALARPWGRPLATCAAVVSLLVIVPAIALTALAWDGGLALAAWALWAALRARQSPPGPSARRWALMSGGLAGLALLYRPDLVVAVAAGLAVALWGLDSGRWRRFLAGAALGLAPYLIHLARAGLEPSVRGMLLDPIFHLRGGRRLPIPPDPSQLTGFLQLSGETYLLDWPLPTPTSAQQLWMWFWLVFLANAALLAVGLWRFRADRRSFRSRVLLSVALFSVGMLPQAVQRTDSAHFAWASAVAVGFLPVALAEVLARWAPRLRPWLRHAVAGGAVLVLLLAVIPTFTFRRYADFSMQSFGYHRLSFPITREGRTFYYGRRDAAEALRKMLPDVERIAPPGGRLFVGPKNLRKTPYSDAFLYYLFPELDPATYYIEMDPGVANRAGSGLADDLASADVVILSAIWDDWNEPNDSREVGAAEPVRVLEEQFRRVGVYAGRDTGPGETISEAAGVDRVVLYELYERKTRREG
jgi:4-amino-4-deoxy-L-arabinose transferase-like glycosyltransferase